MYVLKLALRPWKLAPWSQFSTSVALSGLVLMLGFLYWFQQGMLTVIQELKGEQVLTAYIDPSIEGKDVNGVVDQIRSTAASHSQQNREPQVEYVDEIKFVSQLRKHYPELSQELQQLESEQSAVVPRYVSVTGFLEETALEAVQRVKGVESAESSKDRYRQILGAFQVLKWITRLLQIGLAIALFTALIQLSRMNSALQGEAYSLLRLLGASEGSLRMPGLLCGLLVGVLGGVIALVSWSELAAPLADHVRGLSPLLRGIPAPGFQFGLVMALISTALGAICGWIVSLRGLESKSGAH